MEYGKCKFFNNYINWTTWDGAILVGEVKYYAPGGFQRVDTFFDTITITRDGRSSDIVEVRCRNTNFLGTAVNVDY